MDLCLVLCLSDRFRLLRLAHNDSLGEKYFGKKAFKSGGNRVLCRVSMKINIISGIFCTGGLTWAIAVIFVI